jgi:hypothetical protein
MLESMVDDWLNLSTPTPASRMCFHAQPMFSINVSFSFKQICTAYDSLISSYDFGDSSSESFPMKI